MINVLENIPEADPLINPEQRADIDDILVKNKNIPGATMVVLSLLQSKIGHISPAMQAYVSQQLRVPLSEVNGVVSFYSFFTTEPKGKYVMKFCMGTACYVRGTAQLIEKAQQVLDIKLGDTTADGQITIETCRCVGACSQAPVAMVNDNVHGRIKANKLPQIIRKYQQSSRNGKNGK
jgi:NADH:ubiquinone oxidoreductase subunit E